MFFDFLYYSLLAILIFIFLGALLVYFVDKKLPNKIYKGPISDHFDGRRFFNPGVPKRTPLQLLKWILIRHPAHWPIHHEKNYQFPPPPKKVLDENPLVTFIGHSSVLIQWKDVNVIIDPVYSERASPFQSIGPKRMYSPGIPIEDLPPLDLILLSHNHYDHMDIPTLKLLLKKQQTLIITGLGNGNLLKKEGIYNYLELDWWQEYTFKNGLEITFVPSVHSSNRTLFDQDFTLWGGFVIGNREDGHIYSAGDTGYGSHWKAIAQRFGALRLAILPIGAHEARWFMKSVHMNPQDMLDSLKDLDAKVGMAVHFGMFNLADDGIDEAVETLKGLMKEQNISKEKIWIPLPGESKSL